MYFSPFSDEDVPMWDIRDALIQLNLYVNCQAKVYEANDALKTLENSFGGTVNLLVKEFRQCMQIEDEDEKMMACHRKLVMIERYVKVKTGL